MIESCRAHVALRARARSHHGGTPVAPEYDPSRHVVRNRLLILWSLLGGVALVVALLIASGELLAYKLSSGGRDFDSTEWQAWGRHAQDCFDGDSPRLFMVDDLRANHLRIGMRRAAVIRLLGPPDYKWSGRDLEYTLGGDIDCEFLEVSFDKRGTLKLVERMQG